LFDRPKIAISRKNKSREWKKELGGSIILSKVSRVLKIKKSWATKLYPVLQFRNKSNFWFWLNNNQPRINDLKHDQKTYHDYSKIKKNNFRIWLNHFFERWRSWTTNQYFWEEQPHLIEILVSQKIDVSQFLAQEPDPARFFQFLLKIFQFGNRHIDEVVLRCL
jgi:hypothetical protein